MNLLHEFKSILENKNSELLKIKFIIMINHIENPEIQLLKESGVIQWLFNDTSFLGGKNNQENKKLEDIWGRSLMKRRRPDLKFDKQWTSLFGVYLAREVLLLLGYKGNVPVKIGNCQLDYEIYNAMVEIKTQTFFTTGTAGEKNSGVVFKYSDIPIKTGKPLIIILIGGSENEARDRYGTLKGKILDTSLTKQEWLLYNETRGFFFIGITDLINLLIFKCY